MRSPSSAPRPGTSASSTQNRTAINALLTSTCLLGERLAERLWQVAPELKRSITVPSIWEKWRERETRSTCFHCHVPTPSAEHPEQSRGPGSSASPFSRAVTPPLQERSESQVSLIATPAMVKCLLSTIHFYRLAERQPTGKGWPHYLLVL